MTKKKCLYLAGVLLIGCMLMVASIVAEKKRTVVEWNGEQYRLEEVNQVDAAFARPYNKTLDDLGTVAVLAANGAAYWLVILLIFFTTKGKGTAFGTMLFDSFTYGECCVYASSLYHFLKILAGRIRPYMYFPNPSEKGIAEGDFCLSWPSGHSFLAFTAVGFMFSWFLLRFPKSKLRKPVLCVFLLLGFSTMLLRMLSGNHFLTDVLSGATLGFLVSTLVFRVNNAIWGRGQSRGEDEIGSDQNPA